jgi:DNA topoisomerase I
MEKILIIVESPTKIKTLKKFLGDKYSFESSVGHIRDLPRKGFGIDIQNDFEPQYALMDDKKKVIESIKKAAKNADTIYLSPDPDREGEAIAWHILSILPPKKNIKRVTFNAFTKETVLAALKNPRDIDQALVDAQQARRLLDRIVGYKISPILTKRVQGPRSGGLSAGRVQSVALKLIVDREKEIEIFNPIEYWNIYVTLQTNPGAPSFTATLFSINGKKIEKENNNQENVFLISNKSTAKNLSEQLKKATFTVGSIEKKERKKNPVPPFITSTLQQEASRHFGFSAVRTMNTAQTLYEGVEIGSAGAEGLITYMRTDSVRIAPEAINTIRNFIKTTYGAEYLPLEPKHYSTKRSTQDAHEAIRPTSTEFTPQSLERYLTPDQFKLYTLIWHRTLASQMNPAIYDTISVDIQTQNNDILRATGSTIKFPGFLVIYEEKEDLIQGEKKETNKLLPPLHEKQLLKLLEINPAQSFTKPPPRFTEASLVKELEKLEIGRPSTYASIMQKIQNRDYTIKEKGSLKPTELGSIIAKMLEDNFKLIMDITFTAKMENALEQVAENKLPWKSLIAEFWKEFIPTVETAEKEAFVPKLSTDIICPKCNSTLQKIWSRNKYFYGCSHYPECEYTTSMEALNFNKEEYAKDFDWEQHCPKCNNSTKLRFGRYGAFLGCENYPKCKGIINIPKKEDPLLEKLPLCIAIGCDGQLLQRRSRFKKTFFSCSNYPDCDVIVNSIEDLQNKYHNHPKTPYVKKTTSPKKTKGTKSAPLTISQELEKVVGKKVSSRGDVTKKIWEYIKKNNLQNPKNKRQILPDAKLAKVFGSPLPLDMMQIARVLSPHFK